MPAAAPDLLLLQDATLCPGGAMTAAHLRQLLRAALPDKSHHKAAGWFGQTDFLLTRSHVDEDRDSYRDALFMTLWRRWDFWIALPATPAPATPLARAWARLRGQTDVPAAPAHACLLDCHYRPHGGPWLALDDQAPPEALQACAEGWHGVLRYWRLAEGERRAGRPLRALLHAALTPERLDALTLLPVFTGQPLQGWQEGQAWARRFQPHPRDPRALRLQWRNGPGDADEDSLASYQIEAADDAGAAHPGGLRLGYRQRPDDMLQPLPGDAVEHMQRLLQLFAAAERQAPPESADAPPALARTPPFAAHDSDAEVLGPALMALSHGWQAAGRAHAAVVRSLWAAQPEGGPPPLADPRGLHAAAVLQLVRAVHTHADADLSQRLHQRFAFAPAAYARCATGPAVRALRWEDDGTLLAWTDRCWRIGAGGLRIVPADASASQDGAPHASIHGTTVHGDGLGNLHGLDEDGRTLWRHHVGGGAVLCLAPGPGDTLAVGTAGGTLALLRRASGPDPHQYGTSRYAETRRILFWADADAPLPW
ncbi:hypothetical protein [Pulveribacter suum]|uniref:Uncharacterized protein n=1 Tax=Pulveribacter suum TaxID=2116657 RepID=A0A2P1NPV4_9BURK|nr:hypothetical protein [Pulveribacter suum]AVP59081.1 hypothetical protein C7H73_10835 [Pulveribacter suum]